MQTGWEVLKNEIIFNFPSSFYDQIVKTRAATGRAADDDTLRVTFGSSGKFL